MPLCPLVYQANHKTYAPSALMLDVRKETNMASAWALCGNPWKVIHLPLNPTNDVLHTCWALCHGLAPEEDCADE